MTTIVHDLRFAARTLRRSPGFSLVAIATLALGIGATTAIFSVVNAVLLQSLPYPDAGRMVALYEAASFDGRAGRSSVSAPNFQDWRAQAKTLDAMTALRGGEVTVLGLAEPMRLNMYAVSHEYFRLFGGIPARGRTFSADENRLGGAPVAVVSYELWRDALGGREDLTSVRLQAWGNTYTVVGVMPAGFGFPEKTQLWIPIEPLNGDMGRDSHNDDTYARLAPGVSMAQAAAELDGIAKRLKREYPEHNGATGAIVVGLQDDLVGPVRTYLDLLLGAVVLVLLVACVNLASASLARGTARARELAIRAALGAERGRLVRQLLTESVLLSLVGGAAGVTVAHWLVRTLLALTPRTLPRAAAAGIDARVLAFALGLSIVTGLVIGILPALHGARTNLRDSMSAGGRGAAAGRTSVRGVLVGAEVALALVLLVGAGLLIRSFRALLGERTGFDASGVLAVHVALPETRYATGGNIASYYNSALGALRALPGVDDAALINIAPLARSGFGGGLEIEGRAGKPVYADYRIVSPSYFHTMRIPMLAGRSFTDADDSVSTHVTVINQAMANKVFPGEDPIGKRIRSMGMDEHRTTWLTVIGVAGDVRSGSLAAAPGPQHFVSYRQRPERGTFGVLLVRTPLPAALLASVVRSRLRLIDSNVLTETETLDQIRDRSVADRRFTMVVLGGFAALGLLLAAIGIYGVLSYSVSRRTREIGLRMALGAAQPRVVGMVLRDSMEPVLVGAAVGVVAALIVTRVMRALLYQVSAADPLTFAVTVAVLLGVAVLASVIPARRASRVDPMMALRSE